MTYFYIQSNKDWNDKDNNKIKFKYGITTDLYSRLKTDQHSYRSIYTHLYKYQNSNINSPYKEIDKIISKHKFGI